MSSNSSGGPTLLKRRSAKPLTGNLRLRRLTKAYLEPLDDNKEQSPTVVKIDQIYDLSTEILKILYKKFF